MSEAGAARPSIADLCPGNGGADRTLRYTRCMVNEQAEALDDEEATPPPLVILATDDDAVCVDDLCLAPDVER